MVKLKLYILVSHEVGKHIMINSCDIFGYVFGFVIAPIQLYNHLKDEKKHNIE